MIFKIGWIIRRCIYALIFKNINFRGYLGRPVILINPSQLTLKANTRIFPGSRFEMHPPQGRIIISKNCSIGHNFHCTAMGELIIGESTLITPNVCITDIDHDYTEIGMPVLSQKYLYKKTSIGSNCFIGFGAVIQAGTILGSNCIVGANSVVRGSFPNNCVIAGAPARIIKQFDQQTNSWRSIKNDS